MSTPLPPAGLNTPTGAQAATDDVYARMLKSNVQAAIEDIILIDENEGGPQVCTCGMCDVDENGLVLTDSSATQRNALAGAPILYVEHRGDSDPVVLDEYQVAADIEIISPRMIAHTDVLSPVPIDGDSNVEAADEPVYMAPKLEDLLDDEDNSFDPATFDPFDPGIDEGAFVSLAD